MAVHEVNLDDLRRILRAAAGADESIDLDSDILDLNFIDLGYDSLALLETGSRIEREFGIALDDTTITHAETPRTFLAAVNEQLTLSRTA